MATYTTINMTATNFAEVDSAVRKLEAAEGGAFAFTNTFGLIAIYRAQSPSKLPDFLAGEGIKKLYYKGEWRDFSEAVIIREQNRGLGQA